MWIDEQWDTLVEADKGSEMSVAAVQSGIAEKRKREKKKDFDQCKTEKSESKPEVETVSSVLLNTCALAIKLEFVSLDLKGFRFIL